MKLNEIIVYGDSTSLPRPTDRVETLNTWYWKILSDSKFRLSCENRSEGGISIANLHKKILNDAFYLFPKNNPSNEKKLIILNVGVVDAGIHPITYKLKAVNKIPFFGKYAWHMLSKMLKPSRALIQKIWRYKTTSPEKFARNFEKILSFLIVRKLKVCVVLTPIPHKSLEMRSPGFRKNVSQYNLMKESIASKFPDVLVISVDEFKDSYFVSDEDGHHYSKLGHDYVFKKLKTIVGI